MSGITDPAQEFFKDGLWAWVTDRWKKLVADASNFLQINIAAQDIDVEIKQTAAADLTPGIKGWDGSAWRKLPLLWGYSGGYCESLSGTASGAGHADMSGATVSAGEIWIVEAMSFYHTATTAKAVVLRAYANGCYVGLLTLPAATELVQYEWEGRVTLPTGGHIFARAVAPGDGKKIYLRVWGHKMKVAE